MQQNKNPILARFSLPPTSRRRIFFFRFPKISLPPKLATTKKIRQRQKSLPPTPARQDRCVPFLLEYDRICMDMRSTIGATQCLRRLPRQAKNWTHSTGEAIKPSSWTRDTEYQVGTDHWNTWMRRARTEDTQSGNPSASDDPHSKSWEIWTRPPISREHNGNMMRGGPNHKRPQSVTSHRLTSISFCRKGEGC